MVKKFKGLLAFNVAIEAVGTGDAGKGLAVAAREERTLTERIQSFAEEIYSLSKKIITVAENTGNMLKQIFTAIQNTTEFIKGISAASLEQNSDSQLNKSTVLQLDKAVQQNISYSKELTSMSE
ncbi:MULTISPECIES: methyl-accepting chemotaxis protein [unclassified Oceanispirochaeta]|uniref:methyl-accepting chemotaxis protein n=1 Tax=unclassified Oceanispirochaeta TaxID=2635722 RepID=UPI000E094E3F|nr:MULTISPECIES: methyl-accepting chemotaxis protein [unclassified Oceanispirochaeta]MBF9016398.1 hypothetical protein [Oceanispirochaeta sp. M2]NPD72860.1 hypothetical protein [Oceanispirochaeta sp. M1]RDG31438.1 hypothetical protein DV872_12185 [Oceanispirochaeta sp. M1]